MTIARKRILLDGEVRTYHCTTRCVRRAFLCGLDTYSGRSFEHRRQWVRDRLVFITGAFGLDVLGYSVMSNHLHIILRTRPDVAARWSSSEVARRWLLLHPPYDRPNRTHRDFSDDDVRLIVADPARIARLRHRLSSISWFMSHLDEPIARQANKEDGCTGRFWEGRFKCQELLDEAALLACMVYIDLNPIRAEMATCPEDSDFTGACDRIRASQANKILRFLEASPELRQDYSKGEIDKLERSALGAEWLCPITRDIDKSGSFNDLKLDEYLEILDATGRLIQKGKGGCIPPGLSPVLDRLSVNTERWINTVCGYDGLFRRVVGRLERVVAAAQASGRHWFHGTKACQEAFWVAT